jgi:cell division protein FtsB
MSHWIPIKIVDLALDAKDTEIAALKKEVADLKSEVDRFKAEVERLTDAITSGNAITPDAKPE